MEVILEDSTSLAIRLADNDVTKSNIWSVLRLWNAGTDPDHEAEFHVWKGGQEMRCRGCCRCRAVNSSLEARDDNIVPCNFPPCIDVAVLWSLLEIFRACIIKHDDGCGQLKAEGCNPGDGV